MSRPEQQTDPPEKVYKTFTIDAVSKAVDDVARTAHFTITTGGVDRDNDTIAADGWELANFLKNPVVLWAHDYSGLPVARALDISTTGVDLQSTAQFPPKGVHPFADMVFELIKGGFLAAASVGFRPLEYTRDEERGGVNFKRQELLEFSLVPVPSNPEALMVARNKGIAIEPMLDWARALLNKSGVNGDLKCPQCGVGEAYYDGSFCQACGYQGRPTAAIDAAVMKGVSPKDVSLEKADENASWSAPSLSDILGGTGWSEATDAQRRRVAGYFAWAAAMPPATFGDCKLPHHNPKVVWRGVAAAAARMNQAQIPGADMGKVKTHLARHYRQFAKTPPWVGNASAWAVFEKASTGKSDLELFGLLTLAGFADEATALREDAASAMLLTVPPSDGTATGPLCPACGAELVSDGDGDGKDVCPACGWRSPDAEPMTQPYRGLATPVEIQKRGRTLSAANESRIRQAQGHLSSVLATLDRQPPSDDDDDDKDDDDEEDTGDKSGVGVLLVQEPVVIQIDVPDAAVPSPEAVIAEAIRQGFVGFDTLVREQVVVALARARGRVD